MLMNVKNHGSDWLKSGNIKFFRSLIPSSHITMVMVPDPDDERDVVYQFTLSWSECIDCDIEYRFEFDKSLNMFRIIEKEKRTVGVA